METFILSIRLHRKGSMTLRNIASHSQCTVSFLHYVTNTMVPKGNTGTIRPLDTKVDTVAERPTEHQARPAEGYPMLRQLHLLEISHPQRERADELDPPEGVAAGARQVDQRVDGAVVVTVSILLAKPLAVGPVPL
jgi:hypothetical protein